MGKRSDSVNEQSDGLASRNRKPNPASLGIIERSRYCKSNNSHPLHRDDWPGPTKNDIGTAPGISVLRNSVGKVLRTPTILRCFLDMERTGLHFPEYPGRVVMLTPYP